MSNKSGTSEQIISLPKGGGALQGIGEKFAPDLFTGTGNFTVPIAVPSGRNGFQPELNLVYSTGNGNGPFGLGWSLSVPGVSRKTSKGVPQYRDGSSDSDERDTFVLSGAEDLVPVAEHQTTPSEDPTQIHHFTQYRPRTEGLFALIERHRQIDQEEGVVKADYWEVKSKDGLTSIYGAALDLGGDSQTAIDPSVVADPERRDHIFAWKLTETRDPFGNRIVYEYGRDIGTEAGHHWDQIYLKHIRYIDYNDPNDDDKEKFLVSITFEYEDNSGVPEYRPDPFSEYRSGFEIRTRKRCKAIVTRTHPGEDILVRRYQLVYLDERSDLPDLEKLLPPNGVSLLSQIIITGYDESQPNEEDRTQPLPSLEFGYTRFEPAKSREHDFYPLEGDLPRQSLATPHLELADLFGNGLPDIVEMNGTIRYWRNLGGGKFDLPKLMQEAPAGLSLTDPGVQLVDANGDGRIDLLASVSGMSGFFPLMYGGLWDRRSFNRYQFAPSFNLEDPEVKLVDLTGDGVTDAVHSGTRLECFFNDPQNGWDRTRWVARREIDEFPNVTFSDPRVKWGDMSGDGLQDIALIYDGNVVYWPNLGHGNWGPRVHMKNSPRLPFRYNPQRILVGDVDGDGLADIIYVEDTKITLWINQNGNRWSDPIVIIGTPPVSDMDAVRLVDLLGTGISGILWTRNSASTTGENYFFLDLSCGVKSYLLNEMNNHIGAITRVEYAPSTRFYLEDEKKTATRWKTPLPFPVQAVASVEVVDELSKGKLTTTYSYHHGYWDGAEREFRGFGRVDQKDTETFERYHGKGLHENTSFAPVDIEKFSPPLETRTWFQLGPVGEKHGDWEEPDFSDEYWQEDPNLLQRPYQMETLLQALGDRERKRHRDALRCLRGQILRTELYALDGSENQDRPYTVNESLHGISVVVDETGGGYHLVDEAQNLPTEWVENSHQPGVYFPHTLAQRATQWERGNDPMTSFDFTEDFDLFGQSQKRTQIACPRSWRTLSDTPADDYLATRTRTQYASPIDPSVYINNRVAKNTTYEITNSAESNVLHLKNIPDTDGNLEIIGQTINFYDGNAFQGLSLGKVGAYGALVRTEKLVFTDKDLSKAYPEGLNLPDMTGLPQYIINDDPAWSAEYPEAFQRDLRNRGGYAYNPAPSERSAGYFTITERRKYDFHEGTRGLGLVKETQDPLENTTKIIYESYGFLPKQVINPTGLITDAEYDYRLFQPSKIIDPNGNRTFYMFTPLGLLKSIAVMGKENETCGDSETEPGTRFVYDFLAFEQSPPEARQPIWVQTIRREHHVHGTHISTTERDRTIDTREYSDGFGRLLQTRTQAEDVIFGDDVFGNQVLPADQRDPAGTNQPVAGCRRNPNDPPNVVVSGWKVYDNKSQVVEHFEPFYDSDHDFLSLEEAQALREAGARNLFGRRIQQFYDPRGNVIRTLNPDGSQRRVVYGIPQDLGDPETYNPTPWEFYTYDANDLAPLSQYTDADGRLVTLKDRAPDGHHFTPSSTCVDALGRVVENIQRNRQDPDSPAAPLPSIEKIRTRYAYDIRGNLLSVIDALGRKAFHYVYDLANNAIRTESMDGGVRRLVLDAAGNEIERRDSKGALILRKFDSLNRMTHLWASDQQGENLTLREKIEYGDSISADRNVNMAKNCLGQPHRHYDEAGLLRFEEYDFKGNVLENVRQVIRDERLIEGFENADARNWDIQAFRVDWNRPENDLISETEYETSFTYDALNRIKTMTYPRDVDGERKVLSSSYNRAGALKQLRIDGDNYVEHIAYNAKGQRTLIIYGKYDETCNTSGNDVMTRYTYDQHTFCLVRLRSEFYEPVPGAEYAYQPKAPSQPLQDFAYDYDLAGNIIEISDRTLGCGVSTGTPWGQNALIRKFTYDPLYRLTSATGRECKTIPKPRLWPMEHVDPDNCGYYTGRTGTPTPANAPNLTNPYWEKYCYDPAGNMVMLKHGQNLDQASGTPGGPAVWTRHFGMGGLSPKGWSQEWPNHVDGAAEWRDPPGNRLTHLGDDSDIIPQTHFFDANGNLDRETTSRHFEWDHSDRMRVFRTQAGSSEPSKYAHYLYDAAGQRVMKWVRNQGDEYEVTVYINEVFEHYRWRQGRPDARENNHLHLMDDKQRVALKRIGEAAPGDGEAAIDIKYHLGDHLVSSNLVIGTSGRWINREEYYPYGETSFGSFAKKKYRFTGKERDEENGLYYHGARYYTPSLARWISCDPAGSVDGHNGYQYVRNNPLKLFDPSGLQASQHPRRTISLTKEGAYAAQYYADMVVEGEMQGDFTKQLKGWTGGLLASLWCDDETAIKTAATLSLGRAVAGSIPTETESEPFEDYPAENQSTGGVSNDTQSEESGNYPTQSSETILDEEQNKSLSANKAPVRTKKEDPIVYPEVDHARDFDSARREAFKRAGMTDPENVEFVQEDEAGTVVEFRGEGGSKVDYDEPHKDKNPSKGHDKPHVGWQQAGKRKSGRKKGNITYSGPQHSHRNRKKFN